MESIFEVKSSNFGITKFPSIALSINGKHGSTILQCNVVINMLHKTGNKLTKRIVQHQGAHFVKLALLYEGSSILSHYLDTNQLFLQPI